MAESADSNPLQGYFDWQVTTLLLARDLVDPLDPDDEQAAQARYEQAERVVSELTLSVVPDDLQRNPNLDWPPEVMRAITAATLRYATSVFDTQNELSGD